MMFLAMMNIFCALVNGIAYAFTGHLINVFMMIFGILSALLCGALDE